MKEIDSLLKSAGGVTPGVGTVWSIRCGLGSWNRKIWVNVKFVV
jgi:hypothetical protein